MRVLTPQTWPQALAMKAEHPGALPVRGGTDVMVELNFDRRRPEVLLDLGSVAGLDAIEEVGGVLRLGAGVTYQQVIDELSPVAPALAQASRTVGSPQIRHRGTVGGNLGSASPAGDCHPPLLAAGARVELASVRGTRTVPADEFFVGPKRSVLAPDELIAAVWLPPAAGPQRFAKVGTRSAMVIAVCSFAQALNVPGREVRTGIGSAAPTPDRARAAEEYLAAVLPWDRAGDGGDLEDAVAVEFGRLVAAAAAPIDDVRGTAGYRRHALAVIAARSIARCWTAIAAGDTA
ncbi:MAG: xanthine dehydrogenase family protein subunit M [Hamadaea sp.]|nr:xanthine dehydrogenase family protein subunit M [Hamadaea sp.]